MVQIIRDLVDNSINLTRQKLKRVEAAKISAAVEEQILEALCGKKSGKDTRVPPFPPCTPHFPAPHWRNS